MVQKENDLGRVDSLVDGLEPLTIRVTPEQMRKLMSIAKQCAISLEMAGSMIFEAQMEKYENLEDSIRKAVVDSFNIEYAALEERIRAMVTPLIKGRNIKRCF